MTVDITLLSIAIVTGVFNCFQTWLNRRKIDDQERVIETRHAENKNALTEIAQVVEANHEDNKAAIKDMAVKVNGRMDELLTVTGDSREAIGKLKEQEHPSLPPRPSSSGGRKP